MNRREVLTAFLGVPAALAACRRGQRLPLPAGELVYPMERLGHRIRDGVVVQVPPERWERAGVVIVGAGVAGLSAAWRLLRGGVTDVVLVELDAVAGGTARAGRGRGGSYPWGAHYITAPMADNRAMVTLLAEMGVLAGTDADGQPVVAEQHLCRDPQERVFQGGRWHEGLYLTEGASAADLAQLAAFRREVERWAAWRDGRGRRAFAVPVARCSDDPEVTALDRLSMRDWLDQRGLTSPRLRWLVDYACRDDYGSTPEHTSAWAGVFYHAARIVRAGAEARPVVTWPEGNGRLVAHLARAVGARIRLDLAVTELVPVERSGATGATGAMGTVGAGGVDVVALGADGVPAGFRADRVIFAAPHFLTRHVIRPYREAPPAHVAEFRYGAWMVANLALRGRPRERGFPLCWDNVLYDSPSLGYVVNTHQLGLDRGETVFTYYHPLCDPDPGTARARLLALGRDAWADVALADLERAHPEIRGLTTRLDVVRWGHAMIKPRVGFAWGGARAAAQRPFRGIHFAHTDLSGVALFEEAFDHGLRAAEEVLAARGVPFEPVR